MLSENFVCNPKDVIPKKKKNGLFTILLLLKKKQKKLIFSSLTQRCLVVIHLCAAILWTVNVSVLLVCTCIWREHKFGAGLEVLVLLILFWLACLYSIVSVYFYRTLAAFFLVVFRVPQVIIWMDRAGSPSRITSSIATSLFSSWNRRMVFTLSEECLFCFKSRNVFHRAVKSAYTLK